MPQATKRDQREPREPRPRRGYRMGQQQCEWCGTVFKRYNMTHEFCSDNCRKYDYARRARRGAELIHYAMEWRKHRTKGALTDMVRLLDYWIGEDRKKGKERSDDKVES